ncbi:MAG: ComEC/Rec2 family competence protein, partial [Planctomycetota bacterium]
MENTPRPLFPIALAFISGIAVFDYLRLPAVWLLSITAVVALAFVVTIVLKFIRSSFLSDLLLIVLCFLAGAVRLFVAQEVPPNHIANFPHDDVPVYLEGVVTDEPVYYQPRNEFLAGDIKQGLAGYFTVNAQKLSWAGQSDAIRGKVRVSFFGIERKEELSAVRYGNRLRMLGKIYSPRKPTNPGEFDYGQFLSRQGVYKTLRIKGPEHITLLAQGQGSWFWGGLQRLRNFLAGKTDEYFGPEQSALLKALILGERPAVPDIIETRFMQTGTIHYLSVSGLHLAMLTGFLFLLLGGLGVTGRTRAVILITGALLYAVLTGLSTPVTRSLVMITVYLGSEIFIRKSNPFNSLALAGLIITAYNPNEVFSVGFHLSFLSVIAIVSFTPPILALMRYKEVGSEIPSFVPKTLGERLRIGLKKYLLNSIAVSLAATLGVFPLVLKYFHLITPASIIANIALSVLVFLIMVLGFINLPLLALGVYSFLVPIVALLVTILVWLVDLLSRIPYAYFYLPDIPRAFIWVFYGLFLLWLIKGRLKFIREWYFIGALAGMLIWFLIWAFSAGMVRQQDGLTLTMLDVRQGASFVIQTPEGKTILYDCGTFGSRDVGEQVVAPFLWNKGITRIDKLILSHSHLDHINGVQSVLERLQVKEC